MQNVTGNETVVLIHGLGGFPKTMIRFEREFKRLGYKVINIGYFARYKTLIEVADSVYRRLSPQISKDERVHFVCHSMGGLVLRTMLGYYRMPTVNMGAMVTLGSPHKGAHWVDSIPGGQKIGAVIFGSKIVKSLQEYDFIKSLPTLAVYDTLCVRGTKQITPTNPLSWYVGKFLDGSDGFVPYEGTGLPHAKEVDIYEDHLTMLNRKHVIQIVTQHIQENSDDYRRRQLT